MERIMNGADTAVLILVILLNAAILIYSLVRSFMKDKGGALEKWIKLMEAARIYEAEAEGFAHYSAAEKLNYVLSRLRVLATELGCAFDEESMIARIESDIAYSKGVNGVGKNESLE